MPIETNTPNTNANPKIDEDTQTSRSSPARREDKPERSPEPYHKSNKDAGANGAAPESDGRASAQQVRENDSASGEQQRNQEQGGNPAEGDTGHAGTV